jgi:membrane protease YdiL (CAAX protease family)
MHLGKGLAAILVVFSIISYVVSLALGPIMFFSTPDGLGAATRTIHQITVSFFMAVNVPIPTGISVGALFLGVWAIFVVCVVLACLSRGGFLHSIKDILTKSVPFSKTNFLFFMPLASSALLFATILITQFQATQGVQTGSLTFPPQTSPYVILLELAFAPLQEEFAFRITSIGVPVGLFLLFLYRKDPKVSGIKNGLRLVVSAMYSPEYVKEKLGYRNVVANGMVRGISPLEWVLILLTSAVFGAAHFLLGGGWEIGKVTTAFMAGFVFGIVFVAYGAYASVLMHWFFNYYFTVLDMAKSTYGGAFSAISNLALLANYFGGLIVLVVFLLVSALKLGTYLTTKVAGTGSK